MSCCLLWCSLLVYVEGVSCDSVPSRPGQKVLVSVPGVWTLMKGKGFLLAQSDTGRSSRYDLSEGNCQICLVVFVFVLFCFTSGVMLDLLEKMLWSDLGSMAR